MSGYFCRERSARNAINSDTSTPNHSDNSDRPVRRRGPGLPESLLWFVGAWGIHFLGLLFTAGLLIAVLLGSGMPWNPLELGEFLETQQLTLLAGEQFWFVLLALTAAWLRLGGNLSAKLGSRPLAGEHVFLLTCLIVPLATVCSVFHAFLMQGWAWLLQRAPELAWLDSAQAMEVMQSLGQSQPTWALLLVFAVAPALGEELIFRGVIGRGLVARWGMIPGILLTSVLFAAAHVHPVHALAVLPMGIVLHYVYYTTKSFWAPLYLHFGNNAFAVLMSGPLSGHGGDGEITFSALLTVLLSLVVFLAFLWQTRVRYVSDDGEEWSDGGLTLELPAEVPLHRSYSCLSWHLSLGGLVPLVGFLIAYSAHL